MNKNENSHLMLLYKYTPEEIGEMNFLLLPWRTENVGGTMEDYSLLQKICYDLLLLDFAQVLYNTGNTSFLKQIIEEKGFGRKLLPDTVKNTAINLKLLHYTRLVFVANILDNKVLYENIQVKIYDSLDDTRALYLFQGYLSFLKKWVFSPLFIALYTLKYKSDIIIPKKYLGQWENMKYDIFKIFLSFKDNFGYLTAIKALYFWLTRLHEANNWTIEQSQFKNLCKKAFYYDDMENNRVFTYADYFDSILGAQMIREYGFFLNFPVFKTNKIKAYNRNKTTDSIDRQIYDRMSASLIAIQKSNKNELLMMSTSDPTDISNSEFLTIFNFIKYYSFIHFMGHIGELFSYIKAIFEIKNYFDSDLVVIPGSSIALKSKNGFKQGPDGLIGSIKINNKVVSLTIHGIIEIKSYRVSRKKLIAQLKKHHKRLVDEKIFITVSGLDKSAIFLSRDAADSNAKTIQINNLEFVDNPKYYAFVPAYKRRGKNIIKSDFEHKEPFQSRLNFQLIELPWQPTGFQKMGFYYSFWIIQNFGRIGAENDYNRGIDSWILLMRRLLSQEKLNKRTKNSIIKMLNSFEKGVKSADLDWSKM